MVYLNGQRLAMQNSNQTVWWFYENPATGSTRGTSNKMGSEPDPLGVNNGVSAPFQEPSDKGDYVFD